MNTQHIIGQSLLVGKLDQMLSSGRIVHAYLFTGPAGAGKKTLSNLFAQTMLCRHSGDKPCYSCPVCHQYASGNHPDVLRIDAEKGKTSIGVHQIRELQNDIKMMPYQMGKKIYFIDHAHNMTEQAQNALLKTLEEPPSYAVIMLLADNTNSLLPTIISRCQLLKVTGLSREEIAQIIVNKYGWPQEKALTYAGLAQGLPGKALLLAGEEEYFLMRGKLLDCTSCLEGMGIWDMGELFTEYKERSDDLLDLLMLWFRDILILRETDEPMLIMNMDKISLLKEQTKVFTTKALKDMIELVEKTRRILKQNGNYQLTIDNMLIGFQGGAKNAARSRNTI